MNFLDIRSYKKIFILTTIIYGVILVSISLISNFYFSKSSLEELSTQKIQNTFFEKELLLSQFLEQKINQVKSIAENRFFINYTHSDYQIHADYIKELFVSLAKSDGLIQQISYIDALGNEKIKLSINQLNQFDFTKNLVNQSNTQYFKKFISLDKYESGVSDIELDDIDDTSYSNIKFGYSVYDENKSIGVIVVTVKVNQILNLLKNLELYDLYLIYKNEEYILSPNQSKMWAKHKGLDIDIKQDFKRYNEIFTQNSFQSSNIISKELDMFDSNNIKMVLVAKKDNIQNKITEQKEVMVYIMLGIIILSLPLSYILARIPDSLTKELRKLNSSLEKKILQKTQELQELNTQLEYKVKDEVNKNREKDKILFKQSRQAIMGEVISTIAHHWRQPLSLINTIIANQKVQFMLQTTNQKDIEKSLSDIEREVQNLSNIINDFRNFFQPNEKSKDMCEIDKLISDALNLSTLSFSNIQIQTQINIHSKQKLNTYRNELIQVIVSLVKNSCEHFELRKISNPMLVINTLENEKDFIIEVIDNAGGIDESIFDKIFEPYFSTKENKNGTGLGLYISKIIMEEYLNGTINILNIENGIKATINISKV